MSVPVPLSANPIEDYSARYQTTNEDRWHLTVHELSLCRAIAGVVKSHAAGRPVSVVRVQVGALRQVVPEALAFSWTLLRDFEDLTEAELELDLVPAQVSCRACGAGSQITSRFSVACPPCGSADVEIVRGNEFLVTSIELGDLPGLASTEGVHNG